METINTYTCLCMVAPMGEHGLEGFLRDETYQYEIVDRHNKTLLYYKIFLDNSSFYTCSKYVFHRYFTPV